MNDIGRFLIITGEITTDEDLTVDGRVDGRIVVRDATLTIGENADIDADVRAARVIVRGRVNGAITASERVELHGSAAVSGNVSADRIMIVDGAVFTGGIDMGRRTIAAKVAQFKAAQAAAR